jgi:subtilisin-like proprotein convertase family protein
VTPASRAIAAFFPTVAATSVGLGADARFPFRLRNSTQPVEQLWENDAAILLENAFVDTAAGTPLAVPESLRAAEDPGSYIVQADGPLDREFYRRLRDVGAEFVAYVPNNAALVRVAETGARELAGAASVRAVLRYEPYFKLAEPLLALAVQGELLPGHTLLNVVAFPGQGDAAMAALQKQGAAIRSQSRSPFGPLLTVEPTPDSLVALARLDGVQRIEAVNPRVLLNDLARTKLRVSFDSLDATNALVRSNYLDLAGRGITVNLNDTGVDSGHPDLAGRVSTTVPAPPGLLADTNGHGTFVAGTIASSGASSPAGTNASGSLPETEFRGFAPESSLFVLPVNVDFPMLTSDDYLQQTAATYHYLTNRESNPLISNNSWAYDDSASYGIAAASYDAAARDALPDVTGSQPVLYVFGAGNQGYGGENGTGGSPGRILAPGTAKNVLTIGALEQSRQLTNYYVFTNGFTTNFAGTTNEIVTPNLETNWPFLSMTDSDDQVASFSSRGNVGIGLEGNAGRFKPDLVAPGVFLVSTRASQWTLEDHWPFGTSDPYYPILSNLQTQLAPQYRYGWEWETWYGWGTSYAAPAVSGTLAVMEEFFQSKLQNTNYSPALLKALLINGARSAHSRYDLHTRPTINYQGWGVPNLTNSLPVALTTNTPEARKQWPLQFFDQSPTNAIATDQVHLYDLIVTNEAASFLPLRLTLAWTDPPGNPGVAFKLVNDLDLVVSNTTTHRVYYGNDIGALATFNLAHETNDLPARDFVNNVENIFIKSLADTTSTNASTNAITNVVYVIGRRVNVNAVTANTNDVVQDYALVISSSDGELTAPFQLTRRATNDLLGVSPTPLTNGVPVMRQRVGGNFQLLTSTNGSSNQWQFYVFTNYFYTNYTNFSSLTNGSNVAFVTFLPPNLSRPRNLEADIDLYVSRDSNLLSLNPAVVNAAFKSLTRRGTEQVLFTNAPVGLDVVYYIGVKSEDQQGAEFSLIALSTDQAWGETDEFGNRVLHGLPVPAMIPDGSPPLPGYVPVFAFGLSPDYVAQAWVELGLTHQSVGDLVGILNHESPSVTLNNHSLFDQPPESTNTVYRAIYDDGDSGLYSRPGWMVMPTDGPGHLEDFLGTKISESPWILHMVDEAPGGGTGRVDRFEIRVQPMQLLDGTGFFGEVQPNQWSRYFVDVPADASRLSVILSNLDPPLPLDLYLQNGAPPTFTNYDKLVRITPPGGTNSISRFDVPPLNAGRYYVGVYNPNSVAVSYYIRAVIEYDRSGANTAELLSSDTPLRLPDDALIRSYLFVPDDRAIAELEVGVRIDHVRASDLVLHLTSPQGTRVLLAENRGGASTQGYGDSVITTNVFPRTSSGGPAEDRNVIDTGQVQGTVKIDYEFYQVPDTVRIYYQGVRIFDSGLTNGQRVVSVNYGPGTSTDVTLVVNEGGSAYPTTQWTYTASVVTERVLYTVFTENTNFTDLPIKFADPPFTNSPSVAQTNRLVVDDGFESVAPGNYSMGSFVGGWNVSLGEVIVHSTNNPLGVVPQAGTNFLEFLVGTMPSAIATNVSTEVGRQYVLSFTTRRNPRAATGGAQSLAVYTNGVFSGFVSVTSASWRTNTLIYRALDTLTQFELRSASGIGPLLDSVSLLEVVDEEREAFFLPEDFLRPFLAESPFGFWTLEVWDNRVGARLPAPELVSWKLNFIYANTNPPALPLVFCRANTNTASVYAEGCDPLTNTVAGDQIRYFLVEVPRTATAATNWLTSLAGAGSGDLILLFNQDGLPNGYRPGDFWIDNVGPAVGPNESLLLTTNPLPPPRLRPGERYYLGVANANPAETNQFFISVAFDQTDDNAVTVTELTNGIPRTATVQASNVVDYYQFRVSTNATSAAFELFNLSGNVDLVIRRSLPVPNPLPTLHPLRHDYASQNPGTLPELIDVTMVSQPVPLEPGIWFLGVFNRGTNAVTYTVRATESSGPLLNVVTLTNGVPVAFTIASGSQPTNFFLFSVTNAEPAVLFEVYDLNAPADLLVQSNGLPSLASSFTNASGAIAIPAQVVLRTNSGSPDSLPADWYLAVANPTDTNLSFTIRAVVSTNGILPSGIPLQVTIVPTGPPGSDLRLTWPSVPGELYELRNSTNLIDWALVARFTATSHLMDIVVTPPTNAPSVFYQILQVPGP